MLSTPLCIEEATELARGLGVGRVHGEQRGRWVRCGLQHDRLAALRSALEA